MHAINPSGRRLVVMTLSSSSCGLEARGDFLYFSWYAAVHLQPAYEGISCRRAVTHTHTRIRAPACQLSRCYLDHGQRRSQPDEAGESTTCYERVISFPF